MGSWGWDIDYFVSAIGSAGEERKELQSSNSHSL